MKVETIAEAVSIVYNTSLYCIHGNVDAMDLFCYAVYANHSTQKELSAPKVGLSEPKFYRAAMRGLDKIRYQNLEQKYLSIIDTCVYLQNKHVENQQLAK